MLALPSSPATHSAAGIRHQPLAQSAVRIGGSIGRLWVLQDSPIPSARSSHLVITKTTSARCHTRRAAGVIYGTEALVRD